MKQLPCDKEVAREAFAAGREWAFAQCKVKYDARPPAFEEWWKLHFRESRMKESDDFSL